MLYFQNLVCFDEEKRSGQFASKMLLLMILMLRFNLLPLLICSSFATLVSNLISLSLQNFLIAALENSLSQHRSGRRHLLKFNYLLHHGLRRNLGLSYLVINVLAPLTLFNLLSKSLQPKPQHGLLGRLREKISPIPRTQLHFIAPNNSDAATPEHTRLGLIMQKQSLALVIPKIGKIKKSGRVVGYVRAMARLSQSRADDPKFG